MQVTRLSTTPIKGLGLHHPREIEVRRTGVAGDRCFYLVDDRDALFSIAKTGGLLSLSAEHDESTGHLVLREGGQVVAEGVAESGEPHLADFFAFKKVPGRLVPGLVWGANHPYAILGNGSPEAVKAFTRNDVVGFQQKWLRPDNAEIFVVSNLPLSQLTSLALDLNEGAFEPGALAGKTALQHLFVAASDIAGGTAGVADRRRVAGAGSRRTVGAGCRRHGDRGSGGLADRAGIHGLFAPG